MNTRTSHDETVFTQRPMRIRFGEDKVHIINAEEFDVDSWLDADEMKQNYRADVIDFLTEFKRNQLAEEESDRDSDCDGDSEDEDEEDEEEPEPVCSRGLEMFYPGEMKHRKKLRSLFSTNVLRKSNEFNATFEDPEEAEEHLQQFASSLSQTSQKKAHAVGMQDAMEARLVHVEGLKDAARKDSNLFHFLRGSVRHDSTTQPATSKARAA